MIQRLYLFGAAGNLSQKKLLPALAKLKNLKNVKIIGVARRPWTNEQFRQFIADTLKQHPEDIAITPDFLNQFSFLNIDFDKPEDMQTLNQNFHEDSSASNYLYFALGPETYAPVANELGKLSALKEKKHQFKFIFEIPFGHDEKSAQVLYTALTQTFLEKNIFPIDHVLTKNALLEVLQFKKFNSVFAQLLTGENIDHIQISYSETNGVESRGKFYEQVGALRDMVQGHILQALAVVFSDVEQLPQSQKQFSQFISSLKFAGPDYLAIGQYVGYQNEEGVEPNSQTETFVATKLIIQNQTFQNIPIYLKTGKKLSHKHLDIHIIFKNSNKDITNTGNNAPYLTFRISPNSGIRFRLLTASDVYSQNAKPDRMIDLEHCYRGPQVDPYSQIISDLLTGNTGMFVTMEEIIASWKLIDKIREAYSQVELEKYVPGADGTVKSNNFISQDGLDWLQSDIGDFCKI